MKRFLTDREVAGMLCLSVQTLRNDRCIGRGLPYIRVSKKAIRYDMIDVLGYLEKRKVDHNAKSPVPPK